MGKTYKDRRWDADERTRGKRKKFPRVPPIRKRSEPFEDKRFKEKYEPVDYTDLPPVDDEDDDFNDWTSELTESDSEQGW